MKSHSAGNVTLFSRYLKKRVAYCLYFDGSNTGAFLWTDSKLYTFHKTQLCYI